MRIIKKIIIWLIRLFKIGYIPPHIEINKDRMVEIKRLIPEESPLIIDGGSHKGEFIDLVSRQYLNPVVYAYEPIPSLASELREKYKNKKNIIIKEAALGSGKNTAILNVTNKLPASSILNSGNYADKYHSDGMEIKEKINVSQFRLDEEINDSIDILKLDLQGYELVALKGAQGILERIKLILVEVEFVSLYKDQPLFADIDNFLRTNDFRLLNLYDLYTHEDGQLTSGDAIYLNNKYFY